MLPPLCAWILANHQPCNQFALRRRQFCRAHDRLARIEDANHEFRETLDLISTLDTPNLISVIQHTLDFVTRHTIAPGHAQTIFAAAQDRLGQLLDESIKDDLVNDLADDPDDDFLEPPHAPDSSPREAPPYPQPAQCEAQQHSRDDHRPTKAELVALLGPAAVGVHLPPGITLSDLKSAMSHLNHFASMNSKTQPAKITVTPAPSATSTLTRAE